MRWRQTWRESQTHLDARDSKTNLTQSENSGKCGTELGKFRRILIYRRMGGSAGCDFTLVRPERPGVWQQSATDLCCKSDLQLIQKITGMVSRRQDHDKIDAAYIAERISSELGRPIKKSELHAQWSQANRMEKIMDIHIQLVNEASISVRVFTHRSSHQGSGCSAAILATGAGMAESFLGWKKSVSWSK
ncbi:hypothetical protein B0H14DRAFT_2573881 [Mycena olivaceomarginata]|nr:hypothetical protein B0H14DRAFT_2573881 [Mycena olivaceomarginata]